MKKIFLTSALTLELWSISALFTWPRALIFSQGNLPIHWSELVSSCIPQRFIPGICESDRSISCMIYLWNELGIIISQKEGKKVWVFMQEWDFRGSSWGRFSSPEPRSSVYLSYLEIDFGFFIFERKPQLIGFNDSAFIRGFFWNNGTDSQRTKTASIFTIRSQTLFPKETEIF